MKTILISLNWLLSICSLCIDMDASPLWAVLACVAWFGIASYLMRYTNIYEVKRLLVRWRRFRRVFFHPTFDFEDFNRKLEAELRAKKGGE